MMIRTVSEMFSTDPGVYWCNYVIVLDTVKFTKIGPDIGGYNFNNF